MLFWPRREVRPPEDLLTPVRRIPETDLGAGSRGLGRVRNRNSRILWKD